MSFAQQLLICEMQQSFGVFILSQSCDTFPIIGWLQWHWPVNCRIPEMHFAVCTAQITQVLKGPLDVREKQQCTRNEAM